MSEKTHIYLERGQYAEAAATCCERLAFIGEMQQSGVRMFNGYFDVQYARTYAKLALSLQQMGQTAEAIRAAKEFAKTDFSKTINGKHDILSYYVLTDDRPQVMKIFRDIEDFYVSQGDTINEVFHIVIFTKAQWHRRHGEWREADLAAVRAAVLIDSLNLRDRDRQAAEFEVKFKTQEARTALSEAEAVSRIHLIIILALIVILAVGAFALWRIVIAQRQLRQKNRTLFDTVQQMLKKEEKARSSVLSGFAAETLTPSQQLYQKTCELMRDKQPYTDSSLNRETLAQMLGTNYNIVADAIRECASRSHFNTLFREKFKMTPTEYRKVAKEKGRE